MKSVDIHMDKCKLLFWKMTQHISCPAQKPALIINACQFVVSPPAGILL